MVPRCDNRLLVSTLNILTSLLSFSPLALTALELRAWDIIMARTHELIIDLSCSADEADNCSQISDLTVDISETVKPSKILARLSEVIAFISSASEDVPGIVMCGKAKVDLPPPLRDCSSYSGQNSVKELLFTIDTILLNHCDKIDVSVGINFLSAIYNVSLDKGFQLAFEKYDGKTRVMAMLQAFVPGTNLPRVSVLDRMDIATLVLGIARNFIDQLGAERQEYASSFIDANFFSIVAMYADQVELLMSPDFIITYLQIVSPLCGNNQNPLTKDAAQVIALTLANVLRCSFCVDPAGVQLASKVILLLNTIRLEWDLELNGSLLSALLSFRSSSVSSQDSGIKDALDQIFVVAERCEALE